MKVIFLQNVPNAGKAGEMKEVADGYGRNYLIPRRLAARAESAAVNEMSLKMAAKARREARTEAELAEMAHHLDGQQISFVAKTGGKDRLYGSITNSDIAAELEKVTSYAVDKRKIEIPSSIRQTGVYEVTIKLSKDLAPKVKVTVTESK